MNVLNDNLNDNPQQLIEVVLREPIDNQRASWIRRVRSADHKVIGTTLIGFSLIALVLAGFTELLGWLQLSAPGNTFLTPERFYALHTLSDTSFLYLFGLPLFAGLATYVMPLQLGARSSSFPRISAFGTWSIVFGGAFLFYSLFFDQWQGGANVSSPLATSFYSPGSGVNFWLVSTTLVGIGLTCIALDLATTYNVMRARGMTADRTPIFSFTANLFAFGLLATAPVLVAANLMMLIERKWESFAIFDPVHGGSAMLWKTLFEWWNHAAPFLITLLAAGVVSEVLQVATRSRLANNRAVRLSLRAYVILAILGFGQVFFGSPVHSFWNYAFMLIGLALIIPATVLIVSWIQTVRRGSFSFSVPGLYALAFIIFFTFGVACSAALAIPTLGAWLNGSEFGYATWTNLVWCSAAFGGFAGLLHWFPKITGRNFNDFKAKLALCMIALGAAISLLSLSSLGVDGFQREIAQYYATQGGQARWIEAGIGALLAALGVLGLIVNLIQSSSTGPLAGNDPWRAGTLEWYAPSPPPINNFDILPSVQSDTPLHDIRARVLDDTPDLVGTVAQSPTTGRPSLRGSTH